MPLIDRDAEYDVVVIGAGSTGENVAGRVTRGGLTCAIVESELVGGDCSYWACMPSKALLRSGQALRAAQAVDGASQAVTGKLDSAAVLRRRDKFTSHWKDDGQVQWLESAAHRSRARDGTARRGAPRRGHSSRGRRIHAHGAPRGRSLHGQPGVDAAHPGDRIRRRVDEPRGDERPGHPAPAGDHRRRRGRLRDGRRLANPRQRGGHPRRARGTAAQQHRGFRRRGGARVLRGARHRGAARNGHPAGRRGPQTARSSADIADLDGGNPRTIVGDQLLVATGRAPRTDVIGLDTVGLKPRHLAQRGRQLSRRGWWRLALRRGRREPSSPAHPHGQVPGTRMRRRDRGPCQGRAFRRPACPGPCMRPPPTTRPCPRWSSRTRRWPPSA